MDAGIPGFSLERLDIGPLHLAVARGGSGPPLVLLHGYPQNRRCWARVAPDLARGFDVIVPDLRGYGDSDAPDDDDAHTEYSKRRMAADVVALLDRLGIARAHVLGHDRGARVAYRFALDHPDRIGRLGIVEVVPTLDYWDAWTAELALKSYHWTFLAQPAPLPETLISGDPVGYLDHTLARWSSRGLDAFPQTALASYRAQIRQPARVAAMCADYRAGATTDWRLDAEDRAAGRRIAAPLRFLWASNGFPAATGDPAATWRRWADDVSDAGCDAGHFIPEEDPAAVIDTFAGFFAAA